MSCVLDEVERRVLGSLLEKSMAQSDYYPMTEKGLMAACNQKQNRDPVLELDEDDVWRALEALRERGLVTVVLPGMGARSKRYRHEAATVFGWHQRERAVMAELLLRGPQTVGELRGRCSRFVPFDDLKAVEMVLDVLAGADPPMVRQLPREPGRSTVRHAHLLYPDDEQPATSESAPPTKPISITKTETPASQVATDPRVERLENELTELRETVASAVERLERIERELL